jgi:hypothetical protein
MSRLNKDSGFGTPGHQGDRQDDLNDPKEVVGERVMSPVECKEQAAQCRQMAEGEPNLRVQAILMDMARTWDRLAIEAEISQGGGPSLRVIPPLPSQASPKPSSQKLGSL